jgi:hypothetical protein
MTKRLTTFLAIGAIWGLAGCGDDFKWDMLGKSGSKKSPASQPAFAKGDTKESDSYSYQDTVGSYCWIVGSRKMHVQGYGLVAGLGTNGSKQCPENIRKILLDEIRKKPAFQSPNRSMNTSPEQLISSMDTAVVTVEAEIPAYATKGSHFDAFIRALPGSDVKSLEGGRLYTADLHIVAATSDGSLREGAVLATADGPLFMNPFGHKPDAATKTDLRSARIINGGTCLEDRRIHLALLHPSYQVAVRIAKRINDRFGNAGKVADPLSDTQIKIVVPREFRNDPADFLRQTRHLFVPRPPGFDEQRAKKLAEEIENPDAPHEDIALCWEAMGKTVLPIIRPLYNDPRRHVSFYSAQAGLRMLDEPAGEVLIRHALSQRTSFPLRTQAIRELGRVNNFRRNTEALEKLLDDEDPRIRVAACDALTSHRSDRIKTRKIGNGGFIFGLVESDRPPLIYAAINKQPKIVLFGSGIRCGQEVFYAHRDDALILSARPQEPTITLVRKTPYLGIVSDPIPVSRKVADLIEMLGETPEVEDGKVKGVGMNYSQIVEILGSLCHDRAISAAFMLQQPAVADMFGPLRVPGRPESEL